MKKITTIPIEDGFRMPGEYEPHSGCYIIWPERTDNWRLGAKPAQKVFLEVIEKISKYEQVTVIVSSKQYSNVLHLIGDNVRAVEMSNDDSWVRDCGATFLISDEGNIRGIDWNFNAWGGLEEGLYFPWNSDDIIGAKMCELERVDRYSPEDFVLEGGAVHVDGEGTAMVTEECLMYFDRNPKLTKREIEKIICDYLNCSKVLWVPEGIYLDETNGHIDNICNFVKPGVILLAWTDDESDPQYERSLKAYEYLSKETDAKGRKLEIHKILTPKPILITKEESEGVDAIEGTLPRKEGDRLAASYVNYYTSNKAIILPIFNDPHDKLAVQKLQELYPGYTIETIYAREILLGGGNIHCITQQVPRII